jgi:hypothetical protein
LILAEVPTGKRQRNKPALSKEGLLVGALSYTGRGLPNLDPV